MISSTGGSSGEPNASVHSRAPPLARTKWFDLLVPGMRRSLSDANPASRVTARHVTEV